MKREILAILACPSCAGTLTLADAVWSGDRVETGSLRCGKCTRQFPIINSIPRFVESDNYATNFGLQWNRFRETQLDSRSGVPISRERFLQQSGWTSDEIQGRLVLDIGAGAGRFAEVALSLGANLVAVDYSSAVEACWSNLKNHPRLTVIQADIYHLPFKKASFDYVYCFGVLQHTPQPEAAFNAIPPLLAPRGKLAIDVYPKLVRTIFDTHYWLRPLTKRLDNQKLFGAVERLVPILLPLSRLVGRIPVAGRWLRHAIPISNYEGRYPLTPTQLKEWAVLDTYDMLAPAHDHPQRYETVVMWLRNAGLRDIKVFRLGQWVARGTR